MSPNETGQEIPAFIRELMSEASEEELLKATDNVERYLVAALRVHERLNMEKPKTEAG